MNKKSRIIISDVHGCYKTLMALITKLPKDIPITFAGDLIDRGSDSRSVVEFVKNGNYECVLGNHEQMMIEDLKFHKDDKGNDKSVFVDRYNSDWIYNGGQECLDSYVVDHEIDIGTLKEHLNWMKKLPYYIVYPNVVNEKGEYLLVSHSSAGRIWKKDKKSKQFKVGILWLRDPMPPKIKGIFNIFGHTPQYFGPTVKEHFANIDGGCYYKRNGYGKMFALQFPEMIVYEQENTEDKEKDGSDDEA